MNQERASFNPYPGLRPFDVSETYLFFGRDAQSDELLRRLGRKRFLAVVGPSGSGKSSLVRAGLLPALQGGFMVAAGSRWRIAVMRPGGDPIGNLAEALHHPEFELAPPDGSDDDLAMQTAMTEATLHRSDLGLVEAAPHVGLRPDENLLVVVDQFEELFRFKEGWLAADAHDQAAAFVKLILRAAHQTEMPIYVVLTMRSDFLGDCAQFRDLPEAINDGQYLIPRMTRSEHEEAITGPARVSGVEIAPRLVQRLLNDLGDDPDALPIMQHALMRTWDRWHQFGVPDEPIDLAQYEAIGTMAEALSRHAGEAFDELADGDDTEAGARRQQLAERLFRTITTRQEGGREVRRPAHLGEICRIAEAEIDEMIPVIDVFRREGRTFLMPPPDRLLDGASVIDISHESLIRNWGTLTRWVRTEAEDRRVYLRLAESAARHAQDRGALLTDPDLQFALDWVEAAHPTAAWAETCISSAGPSRTLHGEGLETPARAAHESVGRLTLPAERDRTLAFLEKSRAARDAAIAEEQERQARRIRRARRTAVASGVTTLVVAALGLFALTQWRTNRSLRQARDIDLALVYDEKARAALGVADPAKAWLYTLSALAQEVEPDSVLTSLGRLTRPQLWPARAGDRTPAVRRTDGLVYGLAFGDDGELLVGGSGALTWTSPGESDPLAINATSDQQGTTCRDTVLAYDMPALLRALSRRGTVRAWWDKDNWLWVADSVSKHRHVCGTVTSLALSADGRWLAWPDRSGIAVWDVSDSLQSVTRDSPSRPPMRIEPEREMESYAPVRALAFSPDARLLAWAHDPGRAIDADGTPGDSLPAVSVWDFTRQRGVAILPAREDYVTSLAWGTDGVLAAGHQSGVITLWDARAPRGTLREIGRVETGGGPVLSLAFSGDGAGLAAGQDTTVRRLDLTQVAFADPDEPWDLARVLFDPRGARQRIASLKDLSADTLAYVLDENSEWIPDGDVAGPRARWFGGELAPSPWEAGTGPETEFSWNNRHLTYTSVLLNGVSSVIQVPPDERVEMSVEWRLLVDSIGADDIYCPGCVYQFYFGLENEFSECVDSRVMPPGAQAAGQETYVFSAPSNPGVYYITHRRTTSYNCESNPSLHANGPKGAIAAVLVVR